MRSGQSSRSGEGPRSVPFAIWRSPSRQGCRGCRKAELLEVDCVSGKEIDVDLFGQLSDRIGRAFMWLGLRRVQRDKDRQGPPAPLRRAISAKVRLTGASDERPAPNQHARGARLFRQYLEGQVVGPLAVGLDRLAWRVSHQI
jgi:hypothetical protein